MRIFSAVFSSSPFFAPATLHFVMSDINSIPLCGLVSEPQHVYDFVERKLPFRNRPPRREIPHLNVNFPEMNLPTMKTYDMVKFFSPNESARPNYRQSHDFLRSGPQFPLPDGEIQERYSRKVFVGGLPPDIDEDEIIISFRRFGLLAVDWPHKQEMKSRFPPKGYAFLLYQEESSVHRMIEACIEEEDKYYFYVSSPTVKGKPVQIRPWKISDADLVLDASMPLDPRKTVFIGGVPRPLKAIELAMIMDKLYGGVCYAGIDTDPELKYPKGAGRVSFSNLHSYIAAISTRYVQLQHGEIDKRVEVKPYVIDDQMCDECQGEQCGGKFASYFCANVECLQYYCEHCWTTIHLYPGRESHKPLVKEGGDRPKTRSRWC